MRVGFNPNKDKKQEPNDFFHQVIIPVYIPNQEGYFKDSFTILKLSLTSLLNTIHNKTYISVINNGSCKQVIDYLNQLFQEKKIHEIIHTSNIGYVNSMLKGISGQNYLFFTNADADVIFLEGWQEESYKVFEKFSKTGAVTTTPNSRMLKTLTANIYRNTFFSKNIQFTKVQDPVALKLFANSIGNDDFFKKIHLEKYLTICKDEFKAVVGAGHFVVTYRSSIFFKNDKRYTEYVLGGDSDDIFDFPVVELGYWRLSTEFNYTYHMGNVLEEWMSELVYSQNRVVKENILIPQLSKSYSNKFLNKILNKIFAKILFKKPIWRLFLQYKGLSKSEAKVY